MRRARTHWTLAVVAGMVVVGIVANLAAAQAPAKMSDDEQVACMAKIHPKVAERLIQDKGLTKTWIFFTDKGYTNEAEKNAAIREVAENYNPRAIKRRMLRGVNAGKSDKLFSDIDLPVASDYVEAVRSVASKVHVTSRWLNAVSAIVTEGQLEEIAKMPFVKKVQPVARSKGVDIRNIKSIGEGPFSAVDKGGLDYGASEPQLEQINLIALHEAGYTGEGVVIGILDTGFDRAHVAFNNALNPVDVIAEYDFVDDDGNTQEEDGDPYSQHEHGTMILGCIGAYAPGSLVGGAFNASFVLCKTEDTEGEYQAEEDNYVAGLEFIEEHGADMSTASLGYIDWYTQADLDGLTAVTTIAVNTSTGLGIHHTNAAGNEYHDSDPTTSSLIAPADAFDVITCGAVGSSGSITSFSSDGPTADGRLKPEVLALGSGTDTVNPFSTTGYTTADGTSLSTPLVASAVACLIQARPHWSVAKMRERLFETATDYATSGETDPLFVRGYGIVDAYAAYDTCVDAGMVELDSAKYACEDTLNILVNDCGLNTDDLTVETVTVAVDSTSETGVEQLVLTETDPSSAEFMASIAVSTTDATGVLWVAAGDTITVTYNDADDGTGNPAVVTETAVVDCTAPVISNVHMFDVQPRSAMVAFDADEPVQGTVYYGTECGSLTGTASGSSFSASPMVAVSGLQDDTTYFYAVEAMDEAGNTVYDDNGGACYSFTTPEIPDFFTELFDSDNDLDYVMLTFVPNGSFDFYHGCLDAIEDLPTDPTGGTTVTLTDDDSEQITLSAGRQVSLYGTSYSSFYIGSNGFITFTTGNTDTSETLADHFDTPRISALFDDLDPPENGTVSYKELLDRVVITYQDIREYSTSGTPDPNTFQIEMYYDGTIVLSYLDIAATDGLVGLSAGNGVDPDFYETDLSAMDACGPRPPIAKSQTVATPMSTPVTFDIEAVDDGLPSGELTYLITSLPNYTLKDAGNDYVITAADLPYTPVNDGTTLIYEPVPNQNYSDSFQFQADDGGDPEFGGGLSNIATVTIEVGGPQAVISVPMDTDPGWTTEGQWAFGRPTGQGGTSAGESGASDPTAGATGDNVYGYNLDGNYTHNMSSPHYLTTTAFDLRGVTGCELRFQRWLGVEHSTYDHATLEISTDGSTWVELWENPSGYGNSVNDGAWTSQAYDISDYADDEETVYIRWSMGPTDGSVSYCGWNIDDFEIWGLAPVVTCENPGDVNADGLVNGADIQAFIACELAGDATGACECADVASPIGEMTMEDAEAFVNLLIGA